tara:strand:+ start:1982 stop:2104 length:123 start_codon:yes stop_codon:yes gene_type:complete
MSEKKKCPNPKNHPRKKDDRGLGFMLCQYMLILAKTKIAM